MRKTLFVAACLAAISGWASTAAGELRIGWIMTLGNPLGTAQVNGARLALERLGWKSDGDAVEGVPTRWIICDDNMKPEVARDCATKLVQNDNAQIVAGFMWSNGMLAARPVIVRNQRIMMSTIAGASPMAGKQCSRYFISASFENFQTAHAYGLLLREAGLKDVVLLAPNYQAGRDIIAGVEAALGDDTAVKRVIYFKLGNSDYQAELARIRADNPEGVAIFAPGPMGIAFMKQWAAAGLGDDIKLFTMYVVDRLSLPAIGDAAIGSFHHTQWNLESDRPASRDFAKAYEARFGTAPSWWSFTAYDSMNLIASAVRATGGKVDDTMALMRAMRKADYESVRGPYGYNVNGMPIQNFYRNEVVKGPGGGPVIRTTGRIVEALKDTMWEECPAEERLE